MRLADPVQPGFNPDSPAEAKDPLLTDQVEGGCFRYESVTLTFQQNIQHKLIYAEQTARLGLGC